MESAVFKFIGRGGATHLHPIATFFSSCVRAILVATPNNALNLDEGIISRRVCNM
jgi:hypothetical protein